MGDGGGQRDNTKRESGGWGGDRGTTQRVGRRKIHRGRAAPAVRLRDAAEAVDRGMGRASRRAHAVQGLPVMVDLQRPVQHFQRALWNVEQQRTYWLFLHVAVSTLCLLLTATWLLLRRVHNQRLRRRQVQQQEAAIAAELSMMLTANNEDQGDKQ